MKAVRSLLKLFPHGDTQGMAVGIHMADEISGALTLAFSMLTVGADSLDGMFDSRCPICANEDNVLKVVKAAMAEEGITLHNDSMTPPHHVDGNSPFVQTLLKAYEEYTDRKEAASPQAAGRTSTT